MRAVRDSVPSGQQCVTTILADPATRRDLESAGSRGSFYLFLQALHFNERCRVRELEKQSFDRFCQLVALDTLIVLNSLTRSSPERSEFDRLLREFTTGLRQLRQAVERLFHLQTGIANGFGPAHADIINGFIDRINTCRSAWQQMKNNAILAQPPTPEQMHDYERLRELERYRDSVRERRQAIDQRRSAIEGDLATLRRLRDQGTLGPRQIAGASEDVRPMIEEMLRDGELNQTERTQVNERIRQLEQDLREIQEERRRLQAEEQSVRANGEVGREINEYTRRLRGVRPRIDEYLRLQNAEQFRAAQFRAAQTTLRNNLLRDFDAVIRTLSTSRFSTPTGMEAAQQETYKWQAYQGLLE
jgi:polyhydroxyalkanoate synthesis regulator phasin